MGPDTNKGLDTRDYRDLFDNVIDAVCIIDVKGKFLDVNMAMTQLSGFSREEMLEMHVGEFLPDEDVERFKKFFSHLYKAGSYAGYAGKFIDKLGSLKDIEISSKAFYEKNGKIIGSRNIIRDVTEKKKIEQELVNSEQKFRTVITNSEAIIFILDSKGTFTLSEGKGLKALGLNPGEVVGASVFELYRDNQDIVDAVELALNGTSNKLITQVGNLHYDTFYSPYLNPNGECIGVIGLSVDISERIKKEEELELARRKAEESDHLKSAFMANMSHEIRSPMNVILGFSSLLAGDNLSPDDKKKYAKIVESKGDELLQMLTDLIDISKIEAGISSVSRSPVNLNKLLSEYILVAQQELVVRNIHNVEITQSIPDREVKVVSDEPKIRQILNNLLVNAIKFTRQGSIEFGFTANKNQAVVYVRDTGIGISPEDQDIIFERFRQVDDDYDHSTSGTGLGLYISKTLIRLMGGQIWLESVPGSGSTFFFSLPITPAENL